MVNQQIANGVATINKSVGLIVYGFLAGISFIITYPVYKVIKALPNWSASADITATVCFYLVVYFVLYMGTSWVYKGELKMS